jgi:hypothetical protein
MSLSYLRLLAAIQCTLPNLLPTQAVNLALLVNAILLKRTLCLSALARTYPSPTVRRVPNPKHDLLHRLKRLWRFLDNPRIDAQALQLAFIPDIIAKLGHPRWLGLAVDWSMWDSVLPNGRRMHYQLLRIAVPRAGRALPLLQLVYDQYKLPPGKSQNQLEQEAILAVVRALPKGVLPVILADRGFARAEFLEWLHQHHLSYVVRIDRGTTISLQNGERFKCGQEQLAAGQQMWLPRVRYGLYHGRPRGLMINLGISLAVVGGRSNRRKAAQPKEAWYLATNWGSVRAAVAWYRQRWWIEPSFRDSKGRFGLDEVQVGDVGRLGRLVAAMTLALAWLTLSALPRVRALPAGWRAAVCQRGRASLLLLAIELFERLGALPLACLPGAT